MKKKIILIITIVVVFILGILLIAFVLIFKKPAPIITNFNECAAAQYPIMESYPRQCKTPDGRIFVEELSDEFPITEPPSTEPQIEPTVELNQIKLSYDINGCDNPKEATFTENENKIERVDTLITKRYLNLVHYLNYVCCAEMKVEMGNPITYSEYTLIKLTEKNEGTVCFCLCDYKISAKIGPLGQGKYLIQLWGVEFENQSTKLFWEKILEIQADGEGVLSDAKLSNNSIIPKEEFCGISTKGACLTDVNCFTGGCSGQVCQSKNEEPFVTTCEYKDCYNAKEFGVSCKCIDNQCQWDKTND